MAFYDANITPAQLGVTAASIGAVSNPLTSDLNVSGHNLLNAGFSPKVTPIADANYALQPGDSLVAYTSLTADRTVTANPATMTAGKEYTVADICGLSDANAGVNILVSLSSGHFIAGGASGPPGPFTTAAIVSPGGSLTFFTRDNVNVVIGQNNVVNTWTATADDLSTIQVMTIGTGLIPGDQENVWSNAGSGGWIMVVGLANNESSVGSNLTIYIAGSNFANPGLVATPIMDFNGLGGALIPLLLDTANTYLPSIDPGNRALIGSSGSVNALVWDDDGAGHPKLGFLGATAVVQQANTTGAATSLRTFGFIASGGSNYADFAFSDLAQVVKTAITSANRAMSSSTLTNVPDLSLALVAGATYEFEAHLSIAASAITGNQYGVQFSAAGATVEAQIFGELAASSVQSGRISALNTATATFDTAGADGAVLIKGVLTTTTNPGNLTIQQLAVVNSTTTATVYKNSVLTARRIA